MTRLLLCTLALAAAAADGLPAQDSGRGRPSRIGAPAASAPGPAPSFAALSTPLSTPLSIPLSTALAAPLSGSVAAPLAMPLALPALAAGPGLPALALALQSPETVGRELHGTFGTQIPTAYFFRGILREESGLIVEPFLELTSILHDHGQGVLRQVDLTFGQWNSLHTGPTGTGGDSAVWFEHDFYVDLDVYLEERWHSTVSYTAYYSPNGGFETVQEMSLGVAFDDRDLLGDLVPSGLQPSFELAFETSGQADAGRRQGAYAEIAIAPQWPLAQLGGTDIRLHLPVTIGISMYRYFELPGGTDSTFGFLDVGAEVDVPLQFLPDRMGPWDGTLGLHALFLGDSNRARNNGDRTELILTFGMSTRF